MGSDCFQLSFEAGYSGSLYRQTDSSSFFTAMREGFPLFSLTKTLSPGEEDAGGVERSAESATFGLDWIETVARWHQTCSADSLWGGCGTVLTAEDS